MSTKTMTMSDSSLSALAEEEDRALMGSAYRFFGCAADDDLDDDDDDDFDDDFEDDDDDFEDDDDDDDDDLE